MERIGKIQGKRKRGRVQRGAARRSIRPHAHSHPLSALQRRDGMRDPGTENAAGGADPRPWPRPGVPGARLGGGVGTRPEPSPPPLPRGARCLQGVPGCEASAAGVYSSHAKGGLRWDQRTDPDAHSGPGSAHPASSRNRPASGGGNVVAKQGRAHHHSEQESVTHLLQTNRSLLGCAHKEGLNASRKRLALRSRQCLGDRHLRGPGRLPSLYKAACPLDTR